MFAKIETTMNQAREQFSPPSRPTFEGREIVLGPRAGGNYLVAHGLRDGELVVTHGNFKIDAEIQIQGKPSMMTPEGGGGGGHDHGSGGAVAKKPGDDRAGQKTALPAEFRRQMRGLEAAYELVVQAVQQQNLSNTTTAFAQISQALDDIDDAPLTGHARMQWKEFAMLLGNDAVEGRAVRQLAEADRVFLLLKGHMRRMRERMGIATEQDDIHSQH